jgi:hypothetical protein
MSRADAKKVLISFGIEEPTDEQITSYLNSVGGEVQKEKAKADADKAEIERLKEVEKQYTDLTAQNQTAEQKLQAALDAADLAKKDFAKKTNRLEVEKALVAAGLKEDDYKDFIDSMVSENAETSMKLANGFTATIKSQKEAIDKAVRAELLNKTPTPDGGKGDPNVTKSDAEVAAESIAKTVSASNKQAESIVGQYF